MEQAAPGFTQKVFEAFERIEGNIATMKKQMATKEDIKKVVENMENVCRKVEETDKTLNGKLEQVFGALSSKVEGLSSKLDENDKKLGELSSKVGGLSSKLDENDKKLNEKIQKEFEDTNKNVKEVSHLLVDVQTNLKDKIDKQTKALRIDVDYAHGRITMASGRLENATQEWSDKLKKKNQLLKQLSKINLNNAWNVNSVVSNLVTNLKIKTQKRTKTLEKDQLSLKQENQKLKQEVQRLKSQFSEIPSKQEVQQLKTQIAELKQKSQFSEMASNQKVQQLHTQIAELKQIVESKMSKIDKIYESIEEKEKIQAK